MHLGLLSLVTIPPLHKESGHYKLVTPLLSAASHSLCLEEGITLASIHILRPMLAGFCQVPELVQQYDRDAMWNILRL